MNRALLLVVVAGAAAGRLAADQPAAAPQDICQVPANRILGPRSLDRPLPLLAGDPQHGFHPACAVAWATLSPRNTPLGVIGCYRGNLLQFANDSACGVGTGPLWVSLRWVHTSGETQRAQPSASTCQHLETATYAATRDFAPDCIPRSTAPAPAPPAAATPAAQPAAPSAAAPAPVTPPSPPTPPR